MDGDDTLLLLLALGWLYGRARDGASAVSNAVTNYVTPKSAPPGYRPDIPVARNESKVETARRVYDAVYALTVQVGFPDPRLATAIAISESGGNPGAEAHTAWEDSIGLFQINLRAWPRYTREQLLDPEQNARAALQISRSGTNWSPWKGEFRTGRYLKFMERP